MSATDLLHLFEGYGIELEYMIVDRTTLQALPIADKVLTKLAGEDTLEIAMGEIAWSNELAMHVIELKSNGPKKNLPKLQEDMQKAITTMNKELKAFDACLLPTAMHPFFDPDKELRLWIHENKEIYATYDRIFSCKGHGWANLQSVHINLPFANDQEFAKLHAAIRVVLPLLPALAASSPYVEGKRGPLLDNRVSYYLRNQRRIAAIIGLGIPEPVTSQQQYEEVILQPMYREIAPFDPEHELQYEWLNSRAAIARFERHAIEIRLLDIQEALPADFATIATVVSLVQTLTTDHWSTTAKQNEVSTEVLRHILDGVLAQGLNYQIEDLNYLHLFGLKKTVTVREFFRDRCDHLPKAQTEFLAPYLTTLHTVLQNGALAERIIAAVGDAHQASKITQTYFHLADCLNEGRTFQGR